MLLAAEMIQSAAADAASTATMLESTDLSNFEAQGFPFFTQISNQPSCAQNGLNHHRFLVPDPKIYLTGLLMSIVYNSKQETNCRTRKLVTLILYPILVDSIVLIV